MSHFELYAFQRLFGTRADHGLSLSFVYRHGQRSWCTKSSHPPVHVRAAGSVHGEARPVVAEGHNVTWQQGTSGKTVSPELCAEERLSGGPAGGVATSDAECGASPADVEGASTGRKRRRCGSLKGHRRGGVGACANVAAVGSPPLAWEDTPRGWEAETGPPLTSVGLSVSCNRKWERRWREKKQRIPFLL